MRILNLRCETFRILF